MSNAPQIKLPFKNVIEPMLDFLKREEMVSVVGARGFDERSHQHTIASKATPSCAPTMCARRWRTWCLVRRRFAKWGRP
ncbi:MAG: hypothetical protein ABI874_03840 [Chloroflexota bacterium]